jgi:uncharacterized membrane protein
MCDNNVMNNFGSEVYQSAFFSNTIALTITAVQHVFHMLGGFVAIIWIHRFGRRKALFWSAFVMAATLMLSGGFSVGLGSYICTT